MKLNELRFDNFMHDLEKDKAEKIYGGGPFSYHNGGTCTFCPPDNTDG